MGKIRYQDIVFLISADISPFLLKLAAIWSFTALGQGWSGLK
jgi:hypothetical protein